MNPTTFATKPVYSESLVIVLPALNEEKAIEKTISRCLEARERIKKVAGLTAVELIVVSDGSTDRTVEIAQSFQDVKVIVFEQNRGYGAAIKEGWRQGESTLLGFLDADGTCDPNYFAEMCRLAIEEPADVVLGSRLGPESKMPKTRKIGNHIFAFLLGLLCGRRVTDTASGMRVVRQRALKYLYPLPDGLHFTPAMSARALLNGIRVLEIPMRYEERIGSSKLNIFRDGIKFLHAIFDGVLCYRPEKLLLLCFLVCILFMLFLAAYPFKFYIQHRQLEEWMLYRFVVCYLLGSFGLTLALATALTYQMGYFGPRRLEASPFWPFLIASLLRRHSLVIILGLFLSLSVFFLWPGIAEYTSSGHISLHWSRLLAGAFSLFSAMQTAVFALLLEVLSIWKKYQNHHEKFGVE